MRARFRDKPSDAGPADRPEIHGLRLRALNLRNRALWTPPTAVIRTVDALGKGLVTTLGELNIRNAEFWRRKV